MSYTTGIAFQGSGGQDAGLASAIATAIFLIVGALALLNLKLSKADSNCKEASTWQSYNPNQSNTGAGNPPGDGGFWH